MQVDSSIINIPGDDNKGGELKMKAIYIPIDNHPSSEEFVKFLQQPKEEQWKHILLAQQFIESKIDIEKSWENNDYQRELREQKKISNEQIKRIREKNKKLKEDKVGLEEAIEKFENSNRNSLATFSISKKKYGKIKGTIFQPTNYLPGQRSQDLENNFFENGSLYITKCDSIISGKVITDDVYPLICKDIDSTIDIDNYQDFLIAEALLNFKNE